MYCNADLAQARQIEQMMVASQEAFGGVDVLVNNAVVRYASPVDSFPAEAWDRGVAVNLTAAFHTIRLALPGMRRRNWGRIINVSSIYGLIGGVNRINYVTCKTALIGMTQSRRAGNARARHHVQRGLPRNGGDAGAFADHRTDDGGRISLARRG